MAKATHAHSANGHTSQSRKRKRSAALTISEPRKQDAATRVATAQAGTGIASLAHDLADIAKLWVNMDTAEGRSRKAIDLAIEQKDTNSDRYHCLLESNRLLDRVEEHAYGKLRALEKLVIELEPETVDEVLSLAFLLGSALDFLISEHIDTSEHDARTDAHRIERALRAMIRGLIHCGASSPLLDYCGTEDWLASWDEARRIASVDAKQWLDEEKGRQ